MAIISSDLILLNSSKGTSLRHLVVFVVDIGVVVVVVVVVVPVATATAAVAAVGDLYTASLSVISTICGPECGR